jgi:hypothetical protein
MDLYRLHSEEDLALLQIREAAKTGGTRTRADACRQCIACLAAVSADVLLVEWPDKLGAHRPPFSLNIHISGAVLPTPAATAHFCELIYTPRDCSGRACWRRELHGAARNADAVVAAPEDRRQDQPLAARAAHRAARPSAAGAWGGETARIHTG